MRRNRRSRKSFWGYALDTIFAGNSPRFWSAPVLWRFGFYDQAARWSQVHSPENFLLISYDLQYNQAT